ncbi:phospholipid phosphatase-related protein type 4-like [Myxocyprinus asiaticus]|uniref:phospholipid phosphatase-related protein type 4-like n=1 Tax=Myxocyprinus asiaticus TaxID=70543 RepID=UPI002222B5E7|nr:phospholipid phosphatase-related protein type 4-like [Myxocyprinus asiaticus]
MSARERLKEKMIKESVTLLPCFYFVELPLLVSSVASLYFLEWTDIFKPVRWGFSCQDRSLSLPYIEPSHEVIPFLMLLSLTFAAPAITIMIGEGILFCCLSRAQCGGGAEADINAAGCNFNSFIRRGVRFVGVHVFGLCATALITDIIQLSTGYPAPYFLTVCKPSYTHLNTSCNESSFILEDICSGSDPAVINAGRKSFPSQHATLASFAAVYVSMYFNSTLTDSSKLLKPLLVFCFTICAIICGLTRIIQHKNHAIDVYLGFLLGGGIAVYLGLFAVGNFQPSEKKRTNNFSVRDSHRTVTDLCQQGHHLPAKSCSGRDRLSSSCSESILHRNAQHQDRSLSSLKRPGGDVEAITPRSPPHKENMVTFNTLPRVHMSPMDESAFPNTTIHTSSVDSSRSKQLLSQWKSKNENRKHSLNATEGGAVQSPPNSMEVRCSSEPLVVGINCEHQASGTPYLKLATGSTTLHNNPSGIAGGARMPVQLVHIPEEMQENMGSLPNSSSVQDKWLKSMERSVDKCEVPVVRINSNGQPRNMQVLVTSKQQGLLQESSLSSEISSHTSSTAPLQRYKSLTEESGGQSSTGAIIRVEAHPENVRPLVHAHSTDGSSSWTWKSQSSFRQSFELNDLNRDSESSESARNGNSSIDRKRNGPKAVAVPTVPSISTPGRDHHPNQTISTIRVTPMEITESGPGSRDSSLNRKNRILIPERGNSPDTTRNIFYKGTSTTPAFKE